MGRGLFGGGEEGALQGGRGAGGKEGPGMIRDPAAVVTVRVVGTGGMTPVPAEVGDLVHGEQRVAEVAVDIASAAVPGGVRPVTVIAESSSGHWESPGEVTVAEPSWTM